MSFGPVMAQLMVDLKVAKSESEEPSFRLAGLLRGDPLPGDRISQRRGEGARSRERELDKLGVTPLSILRW